MPVHFQSGEKCDGSKVLPSFHMIPAQFENCWECDSLQSPRESSAKERYLCTLRIEKSRFESVQICSVFIVSHDALFKMCRFKFCFQIYRFQNLPAKIYSFRVNGNPFRHIFPRFQNLPESFEGSLKATFFFFYPYKILQLQGYVLLYY